jgi:hypothetical protein
MASFIQPVRPIDTAPPWDWNPGQTFVTAFNETRLTKAKAEQLQMETELERILLPAKVAKAEYDMKKLGYDSQLLEKIYRTQSAALDNSYRGLSSAIGGGGGGGGGGSANPSSGEADADPTSFNLTGTSYDRKSAVQSQQSSQPIAKKPKVDLTGI